MRKSKNPGWYRGRMIRDGEGHAPGVTPGITDAGATGNSTPDASGESDSNNTGDEFDPSAFWTGPAPDPAAAPKGESADGGTPGSDTEQGFAQQLTSQLETMTFGEPIFTQEIAEQINEGNFTGVQDRLNAMGRNIARQALAMQVQVLKPLAAQILAQARGETQGTLNQRDNSDSLVRLFPAAKNPVIAKTIQPIYDQALKNAKGNREKAVAETKEMLRFMAGASSKDLGVEVVPIGQSSRHGASPATDWLDELNVRS